MNLDWKKISLIALIIGSAILMGIFIYYIFFKTILPTTPPKENIISTTTTTGLPISGTSTKPINTSATPITTISTTTLGTTTIVTTTQLTKADLYKNLATNDFSSFTTIDKNGNLLYLNTIDGKFYRLDSNGKKIALAKETFLGAQNVTWSNGREKAIIEFPDGAKMIYDFVNNQERVIPKHWEDFSFSSSDDQIVFKSLGNDVTNRYLAVAKADGSQAKIIENVGENDNTVQSNWAPNNQIIATYTEGAGLDKTNIYFVGQNKENFKLMSVEGRGFEGQWSPDGNYILYSVYNSASNYNPELYIGSANVNSVGDNRVNLNLNTWTDKCTFGTNNTLFCAVPRSLSMGAGFDRTTSNETPDDIYKIDLTTGNKTPVLSNYADVTISRLLFTNNQLFFTDNNFNTYKLDLK
ncbi:MAG: hypothetical protein WCL61_01285 [bacterium]